MDLESKKAQLKEAILPILEEEALELIELNFIVHGRSSTLRLLVDRKEGGINLGDCARLNTRIGAILDEANLLAERYILEAVGYPARLRALHKQKGKIFLKRADKRKS